jgi:hypothetical protein
MDRRKTLHLLAAGGSGALVSWLGGPREGRAFFAGAPCGHEAAKVPGRSIVRTILEDCDPARLAGGPVLFGHRHPEVGEARDAARDGIAGLIIGGRPAELRRLSAESGLPMVAVRRCDARSMSTSPMADSFAEIADRLAADVLDNRIGVLEARRRGDSSRALEMLRVLGKVQARTGLSILIADAAVTKYDPHSLSPDEGRRVLDLIEGAGAKPEKVAVGPACSLVDSGAAIRIARRGAFVRFDSVPAGLSMADRVRLVLATVDAGAIDRLLLSSEFCSGPGSPRTGSSRVRETATRFGPMLLRAGLTEAMLRTILIENPLSFLAFPFGSA